MRLFRYQHKDFILEFKVPKGKNPSDILKGVIEELTKNGSKSPSLLAEKTTKKIPSVPRIKKAEHTFASNSPTLYKFCSKLQEPN